MMFPPLLSFAYVQIKKANEPATSYPHTHTHASCAHSSGDSNISVGHKTPHVRLKSLAEGAGARERERESQ